MGNYNILFYDDVIDYSCPNPDVVLKNPYLSMETYIKEICKK